MAPARAKKAKASPSSTTLTRPLTSTKSPARTPIKSPSKRQVMGITASQKQALIDNLQLEVTERARKLRAQYALQAQSLRTRIEMRINRIPTALRKANMGELLEKYMAMEQATKAHKSEAAAHIPAPQQKGVPPQRQTPSSPKPQYTKAAAPPRGVKRTSDVFTSDKENGATTTASSDPKPIPNKKQRTKPANNKTSSRQATNPSTVLSPKSANSRTLPQSPIRPQLGSPQKSYLSRPTSPLKALASSGKTGTTTSSASAAAASAATTMLASIAGSTQDAPPPPKPKPGRPAKPTAIAANKTMGPPPNKARGPKGAAPTIDIHDSESTRTVSSASTASTGTTIVKKTGVRGGAKAVKATGKKVAVEPLESAAKGGRRVLRKR